MKYQKLSLIPTKNLDNLASFGRVITFPIQLVGIGMFRLMKITDGWNMFPLEVKYKCIKCGHIINFTYNMLHDGILIKSGHYKYNKELYGIKNIYSDFGEIKETFYHYSKPYFHKIFTGEGFFVEDMYKHYENEDESEITQKIFEDEMNLLKEDYYNEKIKLINIYLEKFDNYKKINFSIGLYCKENKDYIDELNKKIDYCLGGVSEKKFQNELEDKLKNFKFNQKLKHLNIYLIGKS